MKKVFADIEIINLPDLLMAGRGYMDQSEVKRMRVRARVDDEVITLCINENLQEFLQLPLCGKKPVILANGQRVECDVVGPVEIRFKNRDATCNAWVLPGDSEPLLGMIPLEELDVLIDPVRQELIVNPAHPDGAVLRV